MPNTDPIDIKFLINSNEVKQMAEQVKAAIRGVTSEGASQVARLGQEYDALFKKVSTTLTQAFGTEKIQQLNTQLQNITDEGEQFNTVLSFIKTNLADLKLDPQASSQVVENIEAMQQSLEQASAQMKEVGEASTQAFDTAGMSVEQMESRLDSLIEKEGQLRGAIARSMNPELTAQYQQGLEKIIAEENALGAALDRVNAKKLAGGNENSQASASQKSVKAMQQEVNTSKILAGSMRGLFGAISSTVLMTQMFGGENDKLGQTMMKLFGVYMVVMGAMDAIKGARELGNAVTLISQQITQKLTVSKTANIAATEAETAATMAQTTATEGATAATVALDAAMDANPIGIVILAVAALATAVVALTKNTQDYTDIQKELNDALAQTNQTLTELIDLDNSYLHDSTEAAKNAVSLAQAQGKSQQEINDLKGKAIEAERKEAIVKMSSAGYTSDEMKKAEARLAIYDEEIRKLQAIPASERKENEELQKQLDLLESQRKGFMAIYGYALKQYDVVKKTTEEQKELEATEAKQRKEQAQKSAGAEADARVLKQKEGTKEWLDAEKKAIETHRRISLQSANITRGEIDKINAEAINKKRDAEIKYNTARLSDQESYAKAALAVAQKGSIEEFNAKIALIDLQAKQQENEANISAARRVEIEAEAQKQINDLKKKYDQEQSEDEINIAIATIEAKLAEAKKGSEDELELQKQLAEKKAALEALQANSSITNAKLLSAKLLEIHAQLNAKKQKLDEGYFNNQLKNDFDKIDRETNSKLKGIQSNSSNEGFGSPIAKDNAEIEATYIKIAAAQKKADDASKLWLDAIGAGVKDTKKLSDAFNEASSDVINLNEHLQSIKAQKIADRFTSISKIFNNLSQQTQGWNKELSDVFSTLGQVTANVGSLFQSVSQIKGEFSQAKEAASQAKEAFNKGNKELSDSLTILSKAKRMQGIFDAISLGIGGVINMIGMLSSASARRHQAEAQFQTQLIQQQDEYNLALNNAIALNAQLKDTVFITDYAGEMEAYFDKMADATGRYNEALKELEDAKVKVGLKDAVDIQSVLSGAGAGAAIGAAVGTVVPVIGNIVGGVVGAIGGAVAGLFGGKKKKDVLIPLLAKYPDLIDKSKKGMEQFNDELAKSLIDSKLVTGQSAETLKQLIQWKEQAKEAADEIDGIVKTLAGDLGSNLRDSLVKAFEDGTDAGKAFANSVGQTLQNVLSQLIFNQVFGNAFDQLKDKMDESFSPTGDKNWQDDLQSFFSQYAGLSTEFDDQLKAAQQAAKAAGIDIFQSTNGDQQQQGLVGAISRSITEDTANELAGLERGQYDTIKRQFSVLSQSLAVQQKIEVNTANTVTRLDSAISELKKISTNTKPSQTSRDLGVH